MKLVLISDAWEPQTNGVVTTLEEVSRHFLRRGIDVMVLHPGLFRTLPLPSYPEIRLAIDPWRIGRLIRAERPNAIHIATEGPLGIAARLMLTRRSIPFSTSLHTKFPEYVAARTRRPISIGYAYLWWFHRPSSATLVMTTSHRRELAARNLEHLVVWGRGVDTRRFAPRRRCRRTRPRLLYVGRVATEKNLEAFLDLGIGATKVVVGDGPARAELQRRYGVVEWAGYRYGADLAGFYAAADVFVFPSRTDTFGPVMLEAMACGTPVAAHPVTGPVDVVVDGVNGAPDTDLGRAVRRALMLDRERCRRFALCHDWHSIAERVAAHLPLIDWTAPGDTGDRMLNHLRPHSVVGPRNRAPNRG